MTTAPARPTSSTSVTMPAHWPAVSQPVLASPATSQIATIVAQTMSARLVMPRPLLVAHEGSDADDAPTIALLFKFEVFLARPRLVCHEG